MHDFKECDWKDIYKTAKESISSNMSEPKGKDINLRIFVYSDHAGDTVTRRARTRFFIFIQMSLVSQFSKKQSTIKTSVFGAEFVGMKVAMEIVRGFRYKLV